MEPFSNLDNVELKCLSLSTTFMSAKQIAQDVGCHEKDIRNILYRSARRLGYETIRDMKRKFLQEQAPVLFDFDRISDKVHQVFIQQPFEGSLEIEAGVTLPS